MMKIEAHFSHPISPVGLSSVLKDQRWSVNPVIPRPITQLRVSIELFVPCSGVSDCVETDRSVRECAEAFEVPTLGEETIHLSKIKRNLCTQSEVTLSGKPTIATKPARKGSARLPRRGDRVEFVIERTKGQSDSETIGQLDGLVKGRRVSSKGRRSKFIVQLDGGVDGSSSEDDSDLDDSSDDDIGGPSDVVDEDPLNSDDDVGDDAEEQKDFDTNDTIVCLWEKVYRVRTKWKFFLKDGIMHLGGYEYVFQKGTGEADW